MDEQTPLLPGPAPTDAASSPATVDDTTVEVEFPTLVGDDAPDDDDAADEDEAPDSDDDQPLDAAEIARLQARAARADELESHLTNQTFTGERHNARAWLNNELKKVDGNAPYAENPDQYRDGWRTHLTERYDAWLADINHRATLNEQAVRAEEKKADFLRLAKRERNLTDKSVKFLMGLPVATEVDIRVFNAVLDRETELATEIKTTTTKQKKAVRDKRAAERLASGADTVPGGAGAVRKRLDPSSDEYLFALLNGGRPASR